MPTQYIDMNGVTSVSFNNQNVNKIIFNNTTIWENSGYIEFVSLQPFTLSIIDNTKYWDGTIETSTDAINWTIWDGASAVSSSSGLGCVLYVRGYNNTYITGSSASATKAGWVLTPQSTSKIYLAGNLENLLDYTVVAQSGHPIMGSNCFKYIFYGNSYLNISDNLELLPMTTLSSSCYSNMFRDCTSLTSAPVLPATTLAENCYENMFQGCTSLTSAPALPATTLANYCYAYMFYGCTPLTSIPELPATTLAVSCYAYMFYGCTSLTSATTLPVTTLASNCYQGMFRNCTSLTSAPALPATTLASNCYRYMFADCTSLISTPILTATSLSSNAYAGMFSGCTNLTNVSLTLPSILSWTGCCQSMFNGCTSLINAPALPATTLAASCYYGMFKGCTSLTSAPALPATTLATGCYRDMFSGCASLTSIPALPATTLTGTCYYSMFNGCTSIKISSTQTGEYVNAYRIPISGTGTTDFTTWNTSMFANTGGTFTSNPTINTTYYTSNTIVS